MASKLDSLSTSVAFGSVTFSIKRSLKTNR